MDSAHVVASGWRYRVSAVAIILLITAGILVLLEGAVRWVAPPEPSPLDQAGEIITAAGLPTLADLFEPDPHLFWKLRPNLRSVRVQGMLEGYPLDFTVSTDSRGRRTAPGTGGAASPVVWALGDSATFGLGVEDDETWPAWLCRIAGEYQQSLEVINYGVPGYTAWQGLHQLEQLLKSEPVPDMVVAGFWANDKAFWMGRSDPETAQLMMSRGFLTDWIQGLAISRVFRSLFSKPESDNDRPRLNEREFSGCLRQIVLLCQQRHIAAALLVWPSRIQVEGCQQELHGYQRLVQNTAEEVGCFLINPADRFIQSDETCFVDNFHGNAWGCKLAAEVVWEWVSDILNREKVKERTKPL